MNERSLIPANSHQRRIAFVDDPALDKRYDDVVRNLSRSRALFRGPNGQPTRFVDLDWVTQNGIITCLVRPIPDKEEYIRNMPKGNWSDYPPAGSEGRGWRKEPQGSSPDAELGDAASVPALPKPGTVVVNPRHAHDIIDIVDSKSESGIYARLIPQLEGWHYGFRPRASVEERIIQSLSKEGRSMYTASPGFTPAPWKTGSGNGVVRSGCRGDRVIGVEGELPVGLLKNSWVDGRLVGSGSLGCGTGDEVAVRQKSTRTSREGDDSWRRMDMWLRGVGEW